MTGSIWLAAIKGIYDGGIGAACSQCHVNTLNISTALLVCCHPHVRRIYRYGGCDVGEIAIAVILEESCLFDILDISCLITSIFVENDIENLNV